MRSSSTTGVVAVRGLQEFIAGLEAAHPGLVRHEAREIDPDRHEIAAYLQAQELRGEPHVVVFDHTRTLDGQRSQFPLVYNLFETRALCALGIGEPYENDRMDLSVRFGVLQDAPVSYQVMSRQDAPVLQNVRTGDQATVTWLPAARYHEKDAGPYFVMANLMKGRSGAFYDVTMCKNMVHDPKKLSISTHGHHHLTRIIGEHEKDGLPTPVAIVLGHHPAFFLGSCAITPYGSDDYATIGAYMGGPLRVVPSATLGDDFLIPADAEIVIEGIVPPGVRMPQNPFGEITGHYQARMNSPVVDVTAVCFRDGAVAQGTFPGHACHINLGSVPKEGSVYRAIKRVVPDVTAVHIPQSGQGRFTSYIALKKRDFRDVQVAAMVAFSEMPNLKLAIVVDHDIDVFNEKEVLWVTATQTRWDKDVAIIPRVQAFRSWLGDAVCIIDATLPTDVPNFPEHNRIPAEAFERLKGRSLI